LTSLLEPCADENALCEDEKRIVPSVYGWAYYPVAEGIYYVQSVDQQNEHVFEIRFLDFTTAATTVVNRFQSRRGIGLSVSNDRKTILFSGESLEHGNDLVLFENFR
jgi:hypothetical protein